MKTATLLAAVLLALVAPAVVSGADLGLTPATAQDEETMTTPKATGIPPGFEAVRGPISPQEEVSPKPLVIAAYVLVWALVLLYLLLLWRRLERVEREMKSLATRLAQHRSTG